MSEIRITKIDGQGFVTLTDYLRLKEQNKKLKEYNKSQSEVINNVFIPQRERLEEENKKLKEENKNLKEELQDYKDIKAIQKSNTDSMITY